MTKTLFRRLPPIEKWPDWVFALIFFLNPLVVGLLVQLVLLPYVFPAWNAGDGLLVGLDSRTFHRMAVEQARALETGGWQVWSFTGQPVVGIASLFYALIAPHPWAVLPLNAFLHGLAAWVLYKILRFFLEKRSHAFLAALPLFLFPSALSWVTQMHNDNYAVTAGVLLVYAWVCFARKESWKNKRLILGGALALLAGAGLFWLVRDYVVAMYTAVGAVLLVFLIVLFLVRRIRSYWSWKQTLTAIAVVCFTFFLTAALQAVRLKSEGVESNPDFQSVFSGPGIFQQDDQLTAQERDPESVSPGKIWEHSTWLPSWIDNQMEELSIKRTKALRKVWTETRGASNIDTDVLFRNTMDILLYMPRAAEIAFLTPFPADWFGQGSKAPNTMMRRVSGLEMSFAYVSWLGLLFACWAWRKRPEFWAGFIFCFGMLLIYALGTPNVGTLYRLRYPFFMSLVGLGTAGWIILVRNYSNRAKNHLKIASPSSVD